MGIDTRFEIERDDQNADQIRAIAHGELFKTTQAATHVLREPILDNTPHFLGILRKSILPNTQTIGGEIVGQVSTTVSYARPVEFGSKPHWAPIKPLELWVERKLAGKGSLINAQAKQSVGRQGSGKNRRLAVAITRRAMIERTARAIQVAIARRGTRGHHMFEKGFQYRAGRIERMFDECINRILEIIGKNKS